MPAFSTPAVLLRRLDYGDFDLITTFFTLEKGKVTLIAKSAKKSTKRFSGILELFSVLEIVGSTGKGKGLPVLQEAVLRKPFDGLRADLRKTSYASYWAELINNWMEENFKSVSLFYLFQHALTELNSNQTPANVLNILFQMRLLNISGLKPCLNRCSYCQQDLETIKEAKICVDLQKGGILCGNCSSASATRITLSKGTIKQLLWVESGRLSKASRIKFNSAALKEGTEFLEEFVPYHLGRQPRSLKFLRQVRDG